MTRRRIRIVLGIGPLLAGGFAAGMAASGRFSPFVLIWPALALHQLEEYVVTERVLGEEYFLLEWLEGVGYELSPGQILRLDVGIGWSAALAAGAAGEAVPWLGALVIGFLAWNGAWHLGLAVHRWDWAPGMATGLVVYLPLAAWILGGSLREGAFGPGGAGLVLVASGIGHHLMVRSFPRSREQPGPGSP